MCENKSTVYGLKVYVDTLYTFHTTLYARAVFFVCFTAILNHSVLVYFRVLRLDVIYLCEKTCCVDSSLVFLKKKSQELLPTDIKYMMCLIVRKSGTSSLISENLSFGTIAR